MPHVEQFDLGGTEKRRWIFADHRYALTGSIVVIVPKPTLVSPAANSPDL
jgi:hypothetical protein